MKELDKARVSIHVCIAWFTNQSIADKLVEKHKQGIDVKVIFYDDYTNSKFGVNIDGIPLRQFVVHEED
ncbi:phospholipase D-like domain-containing protein [Bacteroides fragilis]